MGQVLALFDRAYSSPQLSLLTMSDAQVRKLWDEYNGTNSPAGYDGEDIRLELNRRGEGWVSAGC